MLEGRSNVAPQQCVIGIIDHRSPCIPGKLQAQDHRRMEARSVLGTQMEKLLTEPQMGKLGEENPGSRQK